MNLPSLVENLLKYEEIISGVLKLRIYILYEITSCMEEIKDCVDNTKSTFKSKDNQKS